MSEVPQLDTRRSRRSLLKNACLVLLLGVLLPSSMLLLAAPVVGVDSATLERLAKPNPPLDAVIALILAEVLVAALVAVPYIRLRRRRSPAHPGPRPIGALAVLVAVLVLVQLSAVDPTLLGQMAGELIVALLVLALMVAVAEELLFRGLGHELLGGAGTFGVLVSGLVFGLPHLLSVGAGGAEVAANAYTVAAMVGIPFAALRERGIGLAALIAIHAAIDVFAFLGSGAVGAQEARNAELIAQVIVATLFAAGWLVWFSRAAATRAATRG